MINEKVVRDALQSVLHPKPGKNFTYKVGLLNADVYGPNIPVILDLSHALEQENDMILPHLSDQSG